MHLRGVPFGRAVQLRFLCGAAMSVDMNLRDFVEHFAGVPGAIFAVALFCFRAMWRLGK